MLVHIIYMYSQQKDCLVFKQQRTISHSLLKIIVIIISFYKGRVMEYFEDVNEQAFIFFNKDLFLLSFFVVLNFSQFDFLRNFESLSNPSPAL